MNPRELRSNRRWAVAVVAAAALGITALAAWGWPATPWPAVLGVALAALAGPAAMYLRLYRRVVEADRQQRALQNVRPLMGPLPLPLGQGRWPILPHTAELLVARVLEDRPRLVVECGSGSSTVLVAACLRELGEGRVVSVDHDERFAESTRRELRLRGLEDWAEVIAAPLEERVVDGRPVRWYGPSFEERISEPIDLLFVDGPPKKASRDARAPAVPALEHLLAPGCVILMDDGDRPPERRAARAWAERLGATATYLPGGRGSWLIRKPAAAEEKDEGAAMSPRAMAGDVENR